MSIATASDEYDLYELVERHVNADTIKDLLRTVKLDHPDRVRVSLTKPELIDQLKSLVRGGELEMLRVFDLLREAEENGSQRIFYFRPYRDFARLLGQPAEVGRRLFGENWEEQFRTPLLTRSEVGTVVDFRPLPHKPRDWLFKLYAYDPFRKLLERSAPNSQRVVHELWQLEEERSVLIVRWNAISADSGWLEFRIPKGIIGRLSIHLANLWSLVGPIVTEADCQPVNLEPAMRRIFATHATNRRLYRIGDTQAFDSADTRYSVTPNDPENGTLADTRSGVRVNQQVLQDEGEFASLVVEWLREGSGDVLPANLRCVLGGPTRNRLHQMCVSSETSAAAVDYVTDQLRHFSR